VSEARDLTGVWYGRYEAIGVVEVNSFIARLDDVGGAVTGMISEPHGVDGAAIRRAFVDGRRTGAQVDFVKQYDGEVFAHAVRYSGLIDDDATEIVGCWSIVRHNGTFVMRREKFSREELGEEEAVDLTVR